MFDLDALVREVQLRLAQEIWNSAERHKFLVRAIAQHNRAIAKVRYHAALCDLLPHNAWKYQAPSFTFTIEAKK